MVYNDASTKLGIINEVNSLCDSDDNTYTLNDKTRRINAALEEIVGRLIASDKRWSFGDSRYTSLPTGLITMVAGTQAYALPNSPPDLANSTALLTFLRAEVKDANGIWHLLKPINLQDITVAQPEYQKTNGLPTEYEKRENFILLYPAPSASATTLTSGLKVYFQRGPTLFTATDTTAVPGIASPFHPLLAYKAALPYCLTYKKDRVAMIMSEITRLEKELFSFEGQKAQDSPMRMSPGQDSNK